MERKPLKKINAKHEIFIREMLEHGHQTKAYQKAYPGTSEESAANSASRLMHQEIMVEQVLQLILEIRQETKEVKTVEAKERLRNYIGIRDTLSEVITGERKFQKLYKEGPTVKPFTIDADASQVIRALSVNIKLLDKIPEVLPKIIRTMLMEDEESNKGLILK